MGFPTDFSSHHITPICDDCFKPYSPPVYYSFEPENCNPKHEGCTGNLCPNCAGPHLIPDDPDDKRKPAEIKQGFGASQGAHVEDWREDGTP